MTNGAQQSSRRPVGVWVISVFYLLSAGWTLLSFALIFSGAIKVNVAQEAYFASLTSVDWFFSLSIGVIGLAGAISLFLLRRLAVVLFSVALVLNLAQTAYLTMRTNWIDALPQGSLFGVFLGWLILVAVILYARSLTKRGVLS
jgi:hypothetical protein